MDDFVISNLHESRNEWCCRLVSIFTPLVQDGLKSLFDEGLITDEQFDNAREQLLNEMKSE